MTTKEILFSCWRIDAFALLVAGAAVVTYVMSQRGRIGTRALSFTAAIVLFGLAVFSPIGVLSDGYLFSAHMLQHLLLVLVVPPLVLLGLAPAANDAPSSRAIGFLFRPIVTWGLGVSAMWLWHAPTLCNAAANSVAMHRVQEVSLLAMGTAFWWPIVGPRATARMKPLSGIVYLFSACTACTVLGIMVTFSPVEVCSVFLHPIDTLGVMPLIRDGWGLTAQKDQQIGGLFMWVPACLVYGAAILGLLARWYRADRDPTITTSSSTTPVQEAS
jgi:putative membrane protein